MHTHAKSHKRYPTRRRGDCPSTERHGRHGRHTLTIGALPALAHVLLAEHRLPNESVETLTRIAAVSPRFCEQLLELVADRQLPGQHLAKDPSVAIAYAIGHAGAGAAYLSALRPKQIARLHLDRETLAAYREIRRLYPTLDKDAADAPPIHFEQSDLRRARTANALIELDGMPPIVTDLSLYRDLAAAAIKRTLHRLSEHDRRRSPIQGF